MEKKKRFLVLGVGLVFLVGLGKGSDAGPLDSVRSAWRDAMSNIIYGPKWNLSMKAGMERKTLYRERGMSEVFLTDPLAPTYETTLSCNPSPKIGFRINHTLRPYTESKCSTRSYGNERLSFDASYNLTPELGLTATVGRDKYRYGSGYSGAYDPFLGMGMGGMTYGYAEDYTQITDRLQAGFNFRKKSLQLSASIGGQQRSYLYPVSEEPSEGGQRNNVGKMSFLGDFRSTLSLSPKLKTTFSANIAPDQITGYYTTGGYSEMHYSQNRLNLTTSYQLNPVLGAEFGYSYNQYKSGMSYGEGAEQFGLGMGDRTTGRDMYWIKIDFRP